MLNKKIGVFDVINVFVLGLVAFLCAYPFYYLIIYSLSNSTEVARTDIWLLPAGFTLYNYEVLLKDPDIWQAFFVSAARTVIGTVLTVFCSAFLAYLLTRRELPCRKFFYRMTVLTMYLNAGLIPYFIIMKNYGLKNNFLLYVIPGAIGAYFVILIKTYMESLPSELAEAATVDGAGPFTIFYKIIMPVCKPILASVSVFSAVNQWNSWQDNFYLVRERSLKTLQLYLVEMLSTLDMTLINDVNTALEQMQKTSSLSMKACIAVVTMLPVMLVYPFFQKYFVKGIMVGSIKG